jgi:Protein of unknown function (DUF2510)
MSNISPPQATAGSTPAGWYADPSGRHEFRYWDGASWTYEVSNQGVRSRDAGYRPGHHDVAEEKSERSSGGSGGFWTSLSGVLTAVAAVTTAAGGIFFATSGNNNSALPASEQSLVAAVDEAGVHEFIESNPDPAPGYSDYTTVTDDSGMIRVDVPVEWSDIDGSAYVLEDDGEMPAVTVASDLDGFWGSYDSPGVEVRATDISVTDIPTALADFEQIECTSYGSQSYEDPAFVGEIELYAECLGTDTVVVVLAAEYKPDPDRIAIVVAQLVEDRDIEAVGRVLDTFDFT